MVKKRVKRILPVLILTGLLLAILIPMASIGAQGAVAEHYTDFVYGASAPSPSNVPPGNANPMGLTIYTDRPTFDGDNPGLPVEDFEGNILPPNNVTACNRPLNSSTNDPCFSTGGVLDGIELDIGLNGGSGQYVVLTQGFLGVTSDVVGPNTFVEHAIWRFNPPVDAVGMDFVWPLGAGTVNIEVRDAGGAVLGTDTQNAPTFWGVSSSVPIGEIFIDDGGTGDLYDNVAFGSTAAPGIAIEKTASPSTVTTNGIVTFTITVSNTGDVDLSNVNVSDPLVPVCDNAIGALAISATVSYNCTDKPTASYTNVVTVTSQLATGAPGPTATASAAVTYTSPTSVSLSEFGEDATTFAPVLFVAILAVVIGVGYAIRRKVTA
jgi:uncharacterized repeat protein (TIGR01451 family)